MNERKLEVKNVNLISKWRAQMKLFICLLSSALYEYVMGKWTVNKLSSKLTTVKLSEYSLKK